MASTTCTADGASAAAAAAGRNNAQTTTRMHMHGRRGNEPREDGGEEEHGLEAGEERRGPILECGTSLAEWECRLDDDDDAWAGGEGDDGGSPPQQTSALNGVSAIQFGEGVDRVASELTSASASTSAAVAVEATGHDDGGGRSGVSPLFGASGGTGGGGIDALRASLAADAVGAGRMLTSPFSVPRAKQEAKSSPPSSNSSNLRVPLVYCDHTASSRPMESVESYLREVCLPLYGNTHTHISTTGSQSTAFVAEARQIVAECTNARVTGKASSDVVVFTGAGATGAVELLIDILGVNKGRDGCGGDDRPVVFVGPFEHHSNLLPWRESGCEVVFVPECPGTGDVDLDALERLLKNPRYGGGGDGDGGESTAATTTTTTTGERRGRRRRRLRMGTFSAASNVTGRTTDVDSVTALLHLHGALAFWDYATAASYLPMDMNPPTRFVEEDADAGAEGGGGDAGAVGGVEEEGRQTQPRRRRQRQRQLSASLLAKDAMFISPHKMLGGPGSPGLLIVKKRLVSRFDPPSRCGGGTVFYVTHDDHRFLSNRVNRYEGGTPNVPGIVRAGLAFLLKRRANERFRRCCAALAEDEDAGRDVDASSRGVVRGEGWTHRTTATAPYPPLTMHQFDTYEMVVETLKRTAPNLVLLGTATYTATATAAAAALQGDDDVAIPRHRKRQPNLPIFSFLIRCGPRFLHYNFVCALLNDLFGIQSRGGCQCAGPYSQRLLGLTTSTPSSLGDGEARPVPNNANRGVEAALVDDKAELLRPGFTRLSLPSYAIGDGEVRYVLRALEFVARDGWAFLPQYRCNHRTGEWRHYTRRGKPLGKSRLWLSHYVAPHDSSSAVGGHNRTPLATSVRPQDGVGEGSVGEKSQVSASSDVLEESFENAQLLLEEARRDQKSISQALNVNDEGGILSDKLEELRWYVYPKECAKWLREGLPLEETGGAGVAGTGGGVVLGALQPLECCGGARNDCSSLVRDIATAKAPAAVPCSESPRYGQESKVPAITTEKFAHSTSEDKVPTQVDAAPPSQSDPANGDRLYYFREGSHHSGEAPLREIKDGFDDGELTDVCEIFMSDTDEWVAITDFLANCAKLSPTNDDDVDTKTGCVKASSSTVVDGKARYRGPAADQDALFGAKDVHVKTKKKPSRDSSTWGHAYQEKESLTHVVEDSSTRVAESIVNSPAASLTKAIPGRVTPPKKMMRLITQAMLQFSMLEDGDNLLLGLSGGKDSLSLLHCLLAFQRKLPIKFTIQVCTVDPMTESFDPSPLIPYVRDVLGLRYHFLRDDIVTRANTSGKSGQNVSSLCSFCARMKRGNLYKCARDNGCNKLVLAQHLDDMAESFLMSMMHNGFLRTMKANYKINAGDLQVIRPLAYCRESLMTEFAVSAGLPVINENCPACFEEPKERARVKKLLSKEETLYPHLYDNMRRAMIPMMHEDATALMRCYTEEAMAKTCKEQGVANRRKKEKRSKSNEKSKPSSKEEEKKSDCHGIVVSPQENHLSHGQSECEGKVSVSAIKPEGSHVLLCNASEEQLVTELARRRKEKFRLFGAMKYGADSDPTIQACSPLGGNLNVPCTEIME